MREAISAKRHDHASLDVSDTAHVDTAAVVHGSGGGVSRNVRSDAGVGALVYRCSQTAASAEQQHQAEAAAVSMIALRPHLAVVRRACMKRSSGKELHKERCVLRNPLWHMCSFMSPSTHSVASDALGTGVVALDRESN